MRVRALPLAALIILIVGLVGGADAVGRADAVGGDRALSQAEPPTVRITQPSDLAAAIRGQELVIEWVTARLDPDGTIEVWFRPPKGDWRLLAERNPGDGSLAWTVPHVDRDGVGRLWVGNLTNPDGETTEAQYEAFHETRLRILADGPPPRAQIATPGPGARIGAERDVHVGWAASHLDGAGTFEVWTRVAGGDWQKLEARAPGAGAFVWTAPEVDAPTSATIWIGNLTNPAGEGDVEQYEVFDEVKVRIVPQAASQGPDVASVEFPETIAGDAEDNQGEVRFRDPDGDLAWAEFNVVEADGDWAPFRFDPEVRGQSRGSFPFAIRCNHQGGDPLEVTYAVTLVDEAGNASAAEPFSFTCEPAS